MTSSIQPHQVRQDMQLCIQSCLDCHSICLSSVTNYNLRLGERYAEAAHIRLLLDCAEICQTSANFMLRGSDLHAWTCGICAEICQRCAQSCREFRKDEMMQRCAEVCDRCALLCERIAIASDVD